MAATEVLVCVVGLSRGQGHVFKSGEGVGKSCLCYRFLHPGFDDFISEHPSIIASHEFQSAAVNNVHFLYWGVSRQNLPGRLGRGERSVDIHVVENTVLYEDVTSKPFRSDSGGKADNTDAYIKRTLGKLESSGKISYWTRDGISLPDTYKAQRYPTNAGKMRRGFAVVVDVSLDGMEFDAQLQRTKLVCKHLKKADATYILVLTKMESVVQESLDKLHQLKRKDKIGADIITTSAMCNYNITATFCTIAEKILKTVYINIPTFEQAAENELSAKTSAKRLFNNFTTKWVQASSERIEDIERTEQYRACKSTVGKYETDRIFAFKLLEVKNSEMLVGVNEDPERRREFLEDFIQMHPDLMLYQSQLLRKIEEHVVDSLLEQPTQEIDSPSRTPRRVHHYPAISSDEGSTASSPAVKPKTAATTGPTERQLSVASAASVGTSSIPSQGGADASDSHSIGSFDSDDGLDYINMAEYRNNKSQSNSHSISKETTSDSALPLPIPPLNTCDTDVVGNEGEILVPNAQNGVEQTSPSVDSIKAEDIRDVQSQDGAAEGNQGVTSDGGGSVTVKSGEALHEDMTSAMSQDDLGTVEAKHSHEILSSNTGTEIKAGPSGKQTAIIAEKEEIQYQITTAKLKDKLSGNGAIAVAAGEIVYQNTSEGTRDAPLDNGAKVANKVASEEIVYQNTPTKSDDSKSGSRTEAGQQIRDETSKTFTETTIIRPQFDTHAPPSTASTPPSDPSKTNVKPQLDTRKPPSTLKPTGDKVKPQPAPKPSTGVTKPKPPPPPRKPKPKTVEKAANDKQTTSPTTTPGTPPSLSPPIPKRSSNTSSPSSPQTSVRDLSSSMDKKLKISMPPALDEPPPESKSAAEVKEISSGDEYVPSEYDSEEEKPELQKEEEKELSPEGDSDHEAMPPPPPIPQRTKNYHKVVLPGEKQKEEASSPASASSHTTPQTSPEKVAESPKDNKDAETTDKNKDAGGKPAKKKRKFYEGWKISKKEEQGKPKSPVKGSSPKKEKKKEPKKKGVKYSQSDRQGTLRVKPVRRAPSAAHRSLPREPRTTFLNMRTRPLPDAPFATPHSPPPEHTLADYDLVDTMLPTSQSFDTGHMFSGSPIFPSYLRQNLSTSPSHLPPRQRSQTHDVSSADNMDYLNEDQFPRPPPSAAIHPLTGAPMRSPPYPAPSSSFSPGARHLTQHPHASGWNQSPAQFNPSPIQSLPPSFLHHPLQPMSEPAHPTGVPYPLPPSARHLRHLPLGRSTSNPNRDHSPPSPDYAYPRIPALDLMRILPHRYKGVSAAVGHPRTTVGIPRSKSTEDDEYVQMKILSEGDDKDEQFYVNHKVIESIRATKRSRSMEDIHEYQNFPTKQQSVFDRTLPLPSRSTNPATTQQAFVLPPRNLLRNPGVGSPKNPQSPTNQLPSKASSASIQPRLSPRPTPKTQREQPAVSQPSSFSPPHTHTQHIITTSPPPHEVARESPPHLEYFPKLKSTTETTKQGHSFKPPIETPRSLPVGTSMWTAEDDPNYYNVVSKSFLFPKPKPLRSPEDNSYVDIIPPTDTGN